VLISIFIGPATPSAMRAINYFYFSALAYRVLAVMSILILLRNFITPHLTRDKFQAASARQVRMQICRGDLSLLSRRAR